MKSGDYAADHGFDQDDPIDASRERAKRKNTRRRRKAKLGMAGRGQRRSVSGAMKMGKLRNGSTS